MRIFVAGGTGVVGRRLVPLLVKEGHTVTGIARTQEKQSAIKHMGASAVDVDLFAPEELRRALAGHDTLINKATHIPPVSRMIFPGAWEENDRVRRAGSANLVDAAFANGVSRFIQESFAPTYPDRGDEWIDESVPLEPGRNTRTVVDAEASLHRFADAGHTGIVLRFGAFYGPDSEAIVYLVNSLRKGGVPVPERAEAFISSISHDDAATAVAAALRAKAGTYNIVDDEPLRRREYYDSLAGALGVGPPTFPPVWTALMLGSSGRVLTRSHRMSNRKFRQETGWAPGYPSVREGWRAVVDALA